MRLKGQRRLDTPRDTAGQEEEVAGGMLIELGEELDDDLVAMGLVPGVAQARLDVGSQSMSLIGLADDGEFSVEELPDALLRFTVAMRARAPSESDASPSWAGSPRPAAETLLAEAALDDDEPRPWPGGESDLAALAQASCEPGVYDDDNSEFAGPSSVGAGLDDERLLRGQPCGWRSLAWDESDCWPAGRGSPDLEMGAAEAVRYAASTPDAGVRHSSFPSSSRSPPAQAGPQAVVLREPVRCLVARQSRKPGLQPLCLALPTSPGDSPVASPVALTARSRGLLPRVAGLEARVAALEVDVVGAASPATGSAFVFA